MENKIESKKQRKIIRSEKENSQRRRKNRRRDKRVKTFLIGIVEIRLTKRGFFSIGEKYEQTYLRLIASLLSRIRRNRGGPRW